MPEDIAQSSGMLALTFFEFVMVCVGLFYTILESNRQKKGEYTLLTWGLSGYFAALILEILSDPSLSATQIISGPFFRVLSNTLAGAGLLILTHSLVSHRLIERKQFEQVLRAMALLLGVSFVAFTIISFASPLTAYGLIWHPPESLTEPRGVFPGEWVFALQQVFIVVYALVALVSQVRERSLYAQGFFLFLAAGRLSFMVYLASEPNSQFQTFSYLMQNLLDPLGFLFLVMSINQLISEDLKKLNLQLLKRTNSLEEATRSLTKLNVLSTSLLKTTRIPDIVETILAGLADEFGLVHTFLLLLDRDSRMLRGFRLDAANRSAHFMDIDMRHDHFLKGSMLRGKPLFFGDSHRMPDRDFIRNYDYSKNLVTVPLLTKKETTCYEMYSCDKVSCPVQAFGWNACWLCKEECPFYDEQDVDDLASCVQCKAFNLMGLLVVDNRSQQHRVDESNLAFLETFANQAGMALHNASLVEDLSREVIFRERTFKSLPNGVMVLDERGLIQSLNPSLLDILLMSDADVTGIPFEAVRLVNDEEKFHAIVTLVLEKGKSYEGIGETWTLTLPGRTLKLNIKVNPLPGAGVRHGAVILFEDITDVTALQEQLFQSEKLATLGQMAAGIAHEVNNPLAGVSGFLQVLASRLPEESTERSAMQAALKDINRASGTISDLLKFARLGPAQKKPSRLNEVLEESLTFLQFQKEHSGIEIRRYFDKELPEIVCDPDQMRMVFTNLVLNAVQAMGSDGTLTVSTSSQNSRVRIFVEDNGPGIPTEKYESIFEPWFTSKQAKGTGLGLTNSDRIVTEHGGVLAFSSVEGEGSTFIVDLPMEQVDSSNEGQGPD